MHGDVRQDGDDVDDRRKLVLNSSHSENDFVTADAENGVDAAIKFVREKRTAVAVSIVAVALGLMAAV